MARDNVVWSGKTTSYHHKWNDTPNPPDTEKALSKVWFLDVQWTDCPVEVGEEVEKIWDDCEYGNDCYIHKTNLDELREKYVIVAQYISEQQPDIGDNELIIIHWWW